MSMNKAQMLTVIAQATGLKRETIKDLMKNGWVFHQDVNGKGVFTSGKRYN